MEIDRQLPQDDEVFLDHIAHFVPDVEAAARALARAGFAPTPVSIQTDRGQLTGTGNITAMLARGYVEVLFKTADTPLGREFDAALARFPGVHLVALAVADAEKARLRLQAEGFRVRPLVALRRPVATEAGEAEAAFTVARVESGEMAEGRIQFLTHHTEASVWQPRWLEHPNGARQLLDAVIAVEDVDEAAARYARFTGRRPLGSSIGWSFRLDRGGLQIMDRATFARSVPAVPVPALPFIGAYAIRIDSLIQAATLLRASGLGFEQRERMLFVPFPPALGAGAWLLVERGDDLPWRSIS